MVVLRGCRGRGSRWPAFVFFAAVATGLLCLFSLQSRTLRVVDIPSSLLKTEDNYITLTESQLSGLAVPQSDNGTTSSRRLRVFMPADGPNINLCKTIMSGVALGYPLPTLLNWDGDFNRPEWHFGGSHIAKLESLLAVIEELLENSENAHEQDLALMVDAYDIWFQLPPSVLIQRFHQLNREADARMQQAWEEVMPKKPEEDPAVAEENMDRLKEHMEAEGHINVDEEADALDDRLETPEEPHTFPISPPRQSIIVTAAKDCNPDSNSGSDPHYELWPQSPMPMDLYGDETDIPTPSITDASRMFHRMRPRCVNSGMIMGTMGGMRDALRRSKEKVEDAARAGRQLWSDQALFAEVIGDQEAWRLWARELASTWNGTAAESKESTLHEHVRKIAAASIEGQRFEFGIGMDYNFTTIPPTCSSEEDGYFNQINDKIDLAHQTEKAGVPDGVRVKGIPPELENSQDMLGGPYTEIQWGYEWLYSDFFFGVTPVGIHHNAYAGGLKPWRLQNWWSRMWFYRMLRELVTYSLRIRRRLERTLVQLPQTGGQDIIYKGPQEEAVTVFNPTREKASAEFVEVGWDAVCQKGATPWYNELFGDEKGPLEL